MSLNYIDNIYQARKNKADVKLAGLQNWLLEHEASLQDKREQLSKLHSNLLLITKEALQVGCDDLASYAPYIEQTKKIKVAEQLFQASLKQACQSYCEKNNYVLYQCSLCEDKGYLYAAHDLEQKTNTCPNCFPELCRSYLKTLQLWQVNYSQQDAYNLAEPSFAIYQAKNTEDLFDEQLSNYVTNYKFCKRFADAVIKEDRGDTDSLFEERRNVLISGACGSGKSYLASKLADYVLLNGVLAIFVTADKLAELYRQQSFLQTAYVPDLRQADYVKTCFSLIFHAPLLVIDDLATSNLQVPHLLDLFNNLKKKQHLVLTTNLDADDIVQTYGERIFSRLYYKAEPISFTTADLRLEL